MIMSSEEKDKVWKELVSNSERRVRSGEGRVRSGERRVRSGERRVRSVREELVSDLKLFMILLVFWISFVSIIEILGL